jgi:hypothetical protein
VVYLVEICEVEHGHVAGPLVEEGLDGAGQFHGRRKP